MKLQILITLMILITTTITSCQPARYDIVNKPGKSDDANPNGFGDPKPKTSFYYDATPGSAYPNEEVKFKAYCDSKETYTVEWDFGDGTAKAKGNEVTHKFKKPGSFKVVGTCILKDGRRINSTATIKIHDPNDPNNPNQNPNQKSPSQSVPTQQDPTQNDPGQNSPNQG